MGTFFKKDNGRPDNFYGLMKCNVGRFRLRARLSTV
jgi:hypothetical protein